MFFRGAFSRVFGVLFAAALVNSVCLSDEAFAQGGAQINSINDGRNISTGTYFNTSGSRTTFENTAGSNLWLHSGTLVNGLGTCSAGTGNGGSLNFTAPGSVVRLDGNIDVSAIRNGTVYTGNGGKIYTDGAFLYQNGTIFATGTHGHHSGHTQFNVSSFTLGPAGAHAGLVHASLTQSGNSLNPGASGMPSIATVVDMKGKVIGKYDSSLIAIKGGLINLDGISIANGIRKQDGPAAGSIVLLAHEQTIGAGNGSLSNSSQGEELQSNLVAGKASLKPGERQWLSLDADAPLKAR